MVRRLLALTAVAVLTTACANERSPAPFYLGAASHQMAPAVPPITSVDADTEALAKSRKTMGTKMLSAMALERVTGRKPDPGRLNAQ